MKESKIVGAGVGNEVNQFAEQTVCQWSEGLGLLQKELSGIQRLFRRSRTQTVQCSLVHCSKK